MEQIIAAGDKVDHPDGDGFVIEIRLNKDGVKVAKVVTPSGFENWYKVSDLKKLEYKERHVRPRVQS